MNVLIIGGGPGGLYAGLLLKKADPGSHIRILERNPDGATYGWGVVFSDRTLHAFREADFPTYQRITDAFVHWSGIDMYYQERLVRAEGHHFAGLSRRKLLQILQDRCTELDVELVFETELTDFSDLAGYDLVIAADGVNSLVRSAFADQFGLHVTEGRSRFIWFGSDRLLDSFSFLFKNSADGLFQVHAYPFDGQMSTFIVECAEDTWRRAGLESAAEADSIEYCQVLFGDFLGGAQLYSNRSLWVNFSTVQCRSWRHENVVLLGDAAHTAHFSIGSGTKLAMDGAIALAQAVEGGRDLPEALLQYEMERRPQVEILQRAASESQEYFENVHRYLQLAPEQFAFHLLTRSGRIHYDNLRTRDPAYADRVDRWFSGPGSNTSPSSIAPPPMFVPFRLAGIRLSNRVVMRVDAAAAADQSRALADSGPGLLLTTPVAVSQHGRITPQDPVLSPAGELEHWKRWVGSLRAVDGPAIGIVLNHAGRRGAVRESSAGLDQPLGYQAWPLWSPSALPYSTYSRTPQELQVTDLERICAQFVAATRLAEQAGFDLLQLHMAHGYLLASFLSPLSNRRADAYGGDLAGRMRFPLEVFESVRQAWPATRPISVALNVDDWVDGGVNLQDGVRVAAQLRERGCDLIQVLAGQTIPDDRPAYGPGYLTHYSDRIRQEAGIATLVGGYLTTSGEMNTILASGRADLCMMSIPV